MNLPFRKFIQYVLFIRENELIDLLGSSKILLNFHRRNNIEQYFPDNYFYFTYFGTLKQYLNAKHDTDIYKWWWNYNLFRKSRLFYPVKQSYLDEFKKFYILQFNKKEIDEVVREEKQLLFSTINNFTNNQLSEHFLTEFNNLFDSKELDIEDVMLELNNNKYSITNNDFYSLNVSEIPGYILDKELCYIYLLAKYYPSDKAICEIGSLAGKSAIALALGIKHSNCPRKVYAIDHWVENEYIYNLFLQNISDFGLEDIIIPIRSFSKDALDKIQETQFSVILIDADHRYEAVKKDFLLYKEKLISDGFLLFHDCYDAFPGIVSLVSELRQDWKMHQKILSLACLQRKDYIKLKEKK